MQRRIGWRHLLSIITLALLAVSAVGCGEEEEASPDAGDATIPMPSGAPLTLSPENAGVGVTFGDMGLLTGHSSFELVDAAFTTAVLPIPILDEKKALEFTPENIRSQPAPVQSKKRTEELLDEIDDAIEADADAEDFGAYVLVIDVFRVNGSWPVRWDGVGVRETDGPGAYDFSRDDMRDEEKDIILKAVAEAHERKPLKRVVVGAAIERLQLVNPEDFGNFVSFYEEVYDAIKAQWPELEVSPGLNWDRFITDVAALYTPGGTVEEVTFAQIRAAWREIAEPLFAKADFLGLQAEPNPDYYSGTPENLPVSQYALLAEVQGSRPVVWYAVNWPVTSAAEKVTQRDYLRKFLEYNAGNDVELIAWKGIRDLGPDACPRIVELGGPTSDCFAGIFTESLAGNRLSDEIEAAVEE